MRRIYEFEDGGEAYWYSAESEAEALAQHHETIVEPSGEPAHIDGVVVVPDDRPLTVREVEGDAGNGVTRTAREWADLKAGMVATTAW